MKLWKRIALSAGLLAGLTLASPQADAKKCNKKCKKAAKKNKAKAEQECRRYRNKYHKACRVKKGNRCGNGWRKVKVFGKGQTRYRACRKKLKAETFNKIRNAYNSTTFLVHGYKWYFKIVGKGVSLSSIPAKLRKKYQKYFSLNLARIRVGQSSRIKSGGMTDCYRIYFKPSRNMLRQIREGIFSGPKNEKLFLHEVAHAEQCYRQGGRNNYAKMWYKHLGVGLLKALGAKKKINSDLIHDKQPMEAAAESKARRIQKQVKHNKVGRAL